MKRLLFLAALLGPPQVKAEGLSGTARELTLPIVCYHRFGEEDGEDSLKISPRRLAEELRWLKKNGYQSLTIDQVRKFMDGDVEGLPEKPVMLSIDDGYRSGWTVGGPIFKKYGFKAVYFIISDQVGASKNFLSWEDLAEINREGFEVESHTMDHTNLGKPLAFKIPIESDGGLADFREKHVSKFEKPMDYHTRLRTEMEGSRKKLEEKLGISVKALAYPFGAFNPTVESYAVDAGYSVIMSVSGGVNIPGDDPNRVRRIIIVGHPSLTSFKKKILEQRLEAELDGLDEGVGFHPDELPHKISIRLPDGRNPSEAPRAEIQGRWITLKKEKDDAVWTTVLEKKMKPGFYFFKVEAGEGRDFARDSYLFQIYRGGMHAYMTPLSPAASTTP